MHPGLLGPAGTRLGGKEECGQGGTELCVFVTDVGEDPPFLRHTLFPASCQHLS